MQRLHFYIMRQITVAFAFTLVALTIVLLFTQAFRLLSLVIDNAAGMGIFFRLAMLLIPTFLAMMLPAVLAIATVFALFRLNGDSELIIMRSAGLPSYSLARPVLVLGAVFDVFALVLGLWIAPWANRQIVQIQDNVRSDFSVFAVRPGVFNDVTKDMTFYARRRDSDGGLEGILFHDNRDPDRPKTLMAERGQYKVIDGEPVVIVFNGQQQEYNRASGALTTLDFARYNLGLSALRKVSHRLPDPRELSAGDLISSNPPPVKNNATRARLWAELHQRIAHGLAVPAFAIFAASIMLGGAFDRRGVMGRIVIVILSMTVLQALLLSSGNIIAKNLLLVPLLYLVAFGPLFLGLWLLRRNPLQEFSFAALFKRSVA